MTFPYIRYGNFYRPLVPVLLSGPTDSLVLEALVDTGADISVVDIELAPVLGVILDERRTVTVSGLAGKNNWLPSIDYLYHRRSSVPKGAGAFCKVSPTKLRRARPCWVIRSNETHV